MQFTEKVEKFAKNFAALLLFVIPRFASDSIPAFARMKEKPAEIPCPRRFFASFFRQAKVRIRRWFFVFSGGMCYTFARVVCEVPPIAGGAV